MAEPTLAPLEETAREVARRIRTVVERHHAENPSSPRVGFALMMFTFGEGGWMTYVSNADRESMLEAMREFIQRNEAQS